MAIQYVGSNTGTWAGANSGTNTVSLTALTGGIASAAAIGDLVIAVYATGSTAAATLSITDGTTAYTLAGTALYANGTSYDSNLRVAYKYLTTSNTSVTFGATGNTQDAGAATVHVFRGVDSTNILDVAVTTATGTATGRPTPPAITPVTAGAFIFMAGGGAAATGAVFTAAALSGFRSVTSADTNDANLGAGYVTWTSGTYTPAQWTGGTTGTTDSWTAATLALRPAPIAVSLTEAASATDAPTATEINNAPQAEAGSAVDSQTNQVTADAANTEAVTASDAADGQKAPIAVASAETASATDSITNLFTASAADTEALTAQDAGAATWTTPVEVIEDHPVSDTVIALTAGFDYVFEFDSADDVADAEHVNVVDVNEPVSGADSPDATTSSTRAATEAAAASDASTRMVEVNAADAEAGTATSSETGFLLAVANRTEATTAVDDLVALLTTQAQALDALSALDAADQQRLVYAFTEEAVAALDLLTTLGSYIATFNGAVFNFLTFNGTYSEYVKAALMQEFATLADASNGGRDFPTSISEAGSVADLVASLLSAVAAASESGAAADIPAATYITLSTIAEAVVAVDIPTNTADRIAAVMELLSAVDAQDNTAARVAALTEAASAFDAASALALLVVARTEAVSGADASTPTVTLGGSALESVVLGDSVFSIADFRPSITEAGNAQAQLLVYGIFPVAVSEQLAASDLWSQYVFRPFIPGEGSPISLSVAYNFVAATVSANVLQIADLQSGRMFVDNIAVIYRPTMSDVSANVLQFGDIQSGQLFMDDVYIGYITD